MKLKSNILVALSRKTVCIAFVVLISVNFSFGNVLSNHCKGGLDCADCVAPAHSHMPGTIAQTENNTCGSGDKNTTCGYQSGRIPADANRIALTLRSDPHEFSGIFVAKSEVNNRPNPSAEFPLQLDSTDMNATIPVYLLNDSLLC